MHTWGRRASSRRLRKALHAVVGRGKRMPQQTCSCPHPTLFSSPAGAFNFSIKRGGLLYGTVEEDNTVKVEFIYEPPQVSKISFDRHY